MLLRLCCLLTVLVAASAGYAEGISSISIREDSARIVRDPEQEFMQNNRGDAEALFKDPSIDQDFNDESLVVIRVKGDFNNDGKPDEMLASSVNIGNGGGQFELYLRDEHGGFHHVGSIATNAYPHITSLNNGSAKITGCWHMSAQECDPYGYIVSEYNIEMIPKNVLPPPITDDNRDSPANQEFIKSNTHYDVCRWKDWLKTGHCDWHEGAW